MNQVLSFLAALVGSFLDPVLMAGCLMAGWYIRPRWVAVLLAMEWNVLLYAVMLKLAFRDEGHSRFFISAGQYLGSCGGVVLATLGTSWLAAHESWPGGASSLRTFFASKNYPVWSLGLLLALALFLAGWITWAQRVFLYFYDLNGPPVYWERANLQPHYWALEIPGLGGTACVIVGVGWALGLAGSRQWPRSMLFLVAAGLYVEWAFWMLLAQLPSTWLP